jgi:hypothetical protein
MGKIMKKYVVTERAVASNRANARKSTGPRTAEGKAITRLNLIKSTLLARESVVAVGDGVDDTAAFLRLLRDLRRELQPRGRVEESLVERLAQTMWRLRRAQQFEIGALREELDESQAPPGLTRQELLARSPYDAGDDRQHDHDAGCAAASAAVARRTPASRAGDSRNRDGCDDGSALATAADISAGIDRLRARRAKAVAVIGWIKDDDIDFDTELDFFNVVPVLNRLARDHDIEDDAADAVDDADERKDYLDLLLSALEEDGADSNNTDSNDSDISNADTGGANTTNTAQPAVAEASHGAKSSRYARLLAACLDTARRMRGEYNQQVRELRRDLPVAKRYDALRADRRRLRRQLPAGVTFVQQVRYENMLDRQFHRTLRELAQVQGRRRKAETLDEGVGA